MNRDDSRWLRNYRPGPPRTAQLVCFPHASGSASFFLPMSRALSDDLQVLAVQYPGRADRRGEPTVPTIGALADAVAEELAGRLARPTALFGHSMGGLVAFEVARRLEAQGHRLLRLFVSGCRAPSRRRPRAVELRDEADVLAELERLGGTDPRLLDDRQALRAVLPTMRNDYRAIDAYRLAPDAVPLRTPIHAHVGDSDPEVLPEEAEAWRGHTTGPFDLRTYPGGHFYLSSPGCDLASVLRAELSTGQRA
ncbi:MULTISPECIES: thioesterase II family protein [Micromonospora]|uniref:Surfactin synthase thioesterase subunit n=1 Tax=Micromonospora yangpuensis TaxID=683228 RepID=A0A1C6UL63_9ACTN|nr:alpha/beta fold hydrolase [Micromonospora yangpuensis]GGM17484.1 thioesterase [Micromonospora yangpuensis]SCL54734.1 Surfactin synthase thioesterase subunit [Micromonospora yangpuensis]